MKKRSLLLFTCLLFITLNACSSSELPTMDFQYVVEKSNPLEVHFSTVMPDSEDYGDLTLEWDMGDGTISRDVEVVHTYKEPGDYKVKLSLSSSKSFYSASETVKTIPVQINIKNLDYRFERNPLSPLEITFEALGSIDNGYLEYEWDFGFSTASGKSATVTFPEPSKYEVTLTAKVKDTNYSASFKKEIDLGLQINALDFTYNPDPFNPLTVEFVASSDTPVGEVEYEWDFGFGVVRKGKSVVNTFVNVGFFDVKLTARILDSNIVEEVKLPISTSMSITNAKFEYGNSNTMPLLIIFTGSADTPNDDADYEWDFGNGAKIRAQNTQHLFTEYGDHLVTLKISIPGTKVAQLITKTITVLPPVIEELDFTITQSKKNALQFLVEATSKSSFGKTTYEWKYGFGKKATGKSNIIEFDDYGPQDIILDVLIDGVLTDNTLVKAIDIPGPIVDDITFVETASKVNPRIRYFKSLATVTARNIDNDTSYKHELEYEWNFGRGQTGEGKEVSNEFPTTGTFEDIEMIVRVKGTNIVKSYYDDVIISNDSLASFMCVNSSNYNIDNLTYTCSAKVKAGFNNPEFNWEITDTSQGVYEVASGKTVEVVLPTLSKYDVALTITDDTLPDGEMVLRKGLVVLTDPIHRFQSVLDKRNLNGFWWIHKVSAYLHKTWYKVNPAKVDVTVDIRSSQVGSGSFLNNPANRYTLQNGRWCTDGNATVRIRYSIKGTNVYKELSKYWGWDGGPKRCY